MGIMAFYIPIKFTNNIQRSQTGTSGDKEIHSNPAAITFGIETRVDFGTRGQGRKMNRDKVTQPATRTGNWERW